MYYSIVIFDEPDTAELRDIHRTSHAAYVVEHAANLIVHGPLLDDSGEEEIGTVMLMDVADMQAGQRLLDSEPLYKAGCFEDVIFHRWRFGRVFDRLKP